VSGGPVVISGETLCCLNVASRGSFIVQEVRRYLLNSSFVSKVTESSKGNVGLLVCLRLLDIDEIPSLNLRICSPDIAALVYILLNFSSCINWPNFFYDAIPMRVVEVVKIDGRVDVTRYHLHMIPNLQIRPICPR
jgi:hypothetical protein